MLIACLAKKGLARVVAILAGLISLSPGPVLAGLLFAAACLVAAWTASGFVSAMLCAAALLSLAAALVGCALASVLEASSVLSENRYGLCSGNGEASPPALTRWLANL